MGGFLADIMSQLESDSIPWQRIILWISLGVTFFESYICRRQEPYFSPVLYPTIPGSLQSYLPASTSTETYYKSQEYSLAKLKFSLFVSYIDFFQTYILLSGVFAPVWGYLGLGNAQLGTFPFLNEKQQGGWTLLSGLWDLAGQVPGATTELRQSLAFMGIMTLISAVIGLPKSWYNNFALEEKFGFNKMTPAIWLSDQLKHLLVSFALELPLMAAIISIIKWVGTENVLSIVQYMVLFIFAFQLVMIPAYPYLIAPLFNKFTKLPEESPVFPLVKQLADRLGFPLKHIWVIDGSTRSSHSNAYFYGLPGLGKHIVIFDTLLDKSTPEEVQAILAHELGHWHENHVPILMLTSLFQTGFSFFVFSLFLTNQSLLRSFGISSDREPPLIISLLLASMLFAPVSTFMHFGVNTITRTLEYQADHFAVKMGKEYAVNLKSALVTIHEKNLAIYGVDWIYSAANNNHPTLVERLEALDSALEIDNKKQK